MEKMNMDDLENVSGGFDDLGQMRVILIRAGDSVDDVRRELPKDVANFVASKNSGDIYDGKFVRDLMFSYRIVKDKDEVQFDMLRLDL